jgi:hypothetical protein
MLLRREKTMNKTEIQTFIEEMKSIGDIWTPEQVEKEYGDYSLEEALKDRKPLVAQFLGNIAKIINRNQ